MKKKAIRLFAAFLTIVMTVAIFALPASYCVSATEIADTAIEVDLKCYRSDNALTAFEGDNLGWQGNDELTFDFNAQTAGAYELSVVWKPLESGVDPVISLKIDGQYPFAAAEKIEILREWKNATEKPRSDDLGNEYAPEQVETGEFITTVLRDYTGSSAEPYTFSLTEGAHSLTFTGDGQKLLIKSITFASPEAPKAYKDAVNISKAQKIDAKPIVIEAESADVKSGDFLIPKANNSDAEMSPTDTKTTKINYIGGTAWKNPGDYLKWNFEVKASGYYYLNFRFKQSDLVNGDSYRRLKIDGKIPFEEARSIKFSYDTDWQTQTFSDGKDNPYYIYLEEGSHTLTLEVDSSNQVEYFNRLSPVLKQSVIDRTEY